MRTFKVCLYFGAFVCVWIFFTAIQFDALMAPVLRYLNLDIFISINKQPSDPYPSNGFLNETEGHCLPNKRFNKSSWYNEYKKKVHAVIQIPASTRPTNYACSRWWHPTPQVSYSDHPHEWSGVLRPENQIVAPCEFGQELRPRMKCAESYQKLFKTLDSLRVVYFPRSGTELGIARGSTYLSADGDIDIYVDMPQSMLFEKLSELLDIAPHMEGTGQTAEVHWYVGRGCPEVNMVYNDGISNEMQHLAEPQDLCSCRMNSVHLLCHRNATRRMYVQYGPSWRVPLGVKLLDMPYWALTNRYHSWTWDLSSKLASLVDKRTGKIEEAAIRELMPTTGDQRVEDMPLVLAQLNILAHSLGLI